MTGRGLLIAAASTDVLAALAHLGAIVGGVGWYRVMGAGPHMADMVDRGLARPHLITLGIAAVLLGWAVYALAGTGVIGRPPLLRTGLIAISLVCVLRALAMFVPMAPPVGASANFWTWSSLVVLAMGLLHAIGTWLMWDRLR